MIIFTCFQSHLTFEQNLQAWCGLRQALKGLGVYHKETIGTFEGKEEHGFAVLDKDENLVKLFCEKYSQQCYLKLMGGLAFLSHLDKPDTLVLLGNWKTHDGKGDWTSFVEYDEQGNKTISPRYSA